VNSFAGILLDAFTAILLGATFLAGLIIAIFFRRFSDFSGKTIGTIAGLSQWVLPLGLHAYDASQQGWEHAVPWEPFNAMIQLLLLFFVGCLGAVFGILVFDRVFRRAKGSIASTFE
jgi:hypothetical protein